MYGGLNIVGRMRQKPQEVLHKIRGSANIQKKTKSHDPYKELREREKKNEEEKSNPLGGGGWKG